MFDEVAAAGAAAASGIVDGATKSSAVIGGVDRPPTRQLDTAFVAVAVLLFGMDDDDADDAGEEDERRDADCGRITRRTVGLDC